MLTYLYECIQCSTRFSTKQKMSDEPYKHCPNCGKMFLKKVIQPSNFKLKGDFH